MDANYTTLGVGVASDHWRTAPGLLSVGKEWLLLSRVSMYLLTQQLVSDNRNQAVNPVPYPLSAPPLYGEQLWTETPPPCSNECGLPMCVDV